MDGGGNVTEFFGLPLDWRLVLVAGAAALGGFLRGFVGFGGALVSVPVLSLVFGPRMAVAVASVMALPSVFQLLPDAIRHSEKPIVVPVGLATLVTTPVGSWLLMAASPALMKIVISGLVVVMVGFLASGWSFKGHIGKPTLIAAGILGGLVQGSAGIGGPPVVAIALSRPGGAAAQRGNVLAVMTAIALSSLLPLIYYGLYTQQAVIIGMLLLPFYVAATVLGSRYFALGGHVYFRRAALGTLAAVGLATFIAAINDYLMS